MKKDSPKYCSECRFFRHLQKPHERRYCSINGRKLIHDHAGDCPYCKFKKGV